jgi:hypothetical protein
LENNNEKMAVKVFLPVPTGETSKKRDLQHGFDSRLDCQYTIMYKDYFVIKISEKKRFECVSMPLMKSSLRSYLNSKLNEVLTDEVLNINRLFTEFLLGF